LVGAAAAAGWSALTEALGGPERTRVIILLAAVLALSSADASTVGASATQLRHALHISNTDVGLLVSVTSLVAAVASLPFGVLADRVLVWTVTLLVLDLDIGTGAAWAVGIASVVASLLLAAYASISLIDLLIQATESLENDLLEHPMPVEGPPVGCAPSAGGSVPYEDVKKLLRQLEKAEPRGEVHDIRVVAEPTRLLHPLETRSAMP
jgi:hypothetical protein